MEAANVPLAALDAVAPAWFTAALAALETRFGDRLQELEARTDARLDTALKESEARSDARLKTALNELEARVGSKLGTLEAKVGELGTRVAALETKIAALETKVAALETKVAALEDKVAALDTKVVALDTKVGALDIGFDRLRVLHANSLLGRDDRIVWPKDAGGRNALDQPWAESIAIANLLVAGNETLPNGTVNIWNSDKSKKALQFYQDDPSDSEAEDGEHSARSRNRRLRLAKHLGISKSQLNFAQLSL